METKLFGISCWKRHFSCWLWLWWKNDWTGKKSRKHNTDRIEFYVADATNEISMKTLKRNRMFTKAVSNMAVMDVPILAAFYRCLQIWLRIMEFLYLQHSIRALLHWQINTWHHTATTILRLKDNHKSNVTIIVLCRIFLICVLTLVLRNWWFLWRMLF